MSRSLGECGLVSESPQDVRLVLERPNTKRGRASRGQWPSHWVATSVPCKMKITTLIKPQTCTLWSPVLPYMVIYMYLYLYLLCQQQQQEWSFLSLHLLPAVFSSARLAGGQSRPQTPPSHKATPRFFLQLLSKPEFSPQLWDKIWEWHRNEANSKLQLGLHGYKKLKHS